MRKEYDFSKGKRGAYNKKIAQGKVTLRLDEDVVEYFKQMSERKGLPYQTLINLFLRSCKEKKLELSTDWKKEA